jgi:tRNA G26 N,N-dimethylase Trm1
MKKGEDVARDLAFEALAEVTGTDWTAGRGELNAALKSIRSQTEVTDPRLLVDLIRERAKMYREAMPNVMLTPTALSKHWVRVLEESARKNRTVGANRHADVTKCPSCQGHRLIETSPDVYERCPDCNPGHVSETRNPQPEPTPQERAANAKAAKAGLEQLRRNL